MTARALTGVVSVTVCEPATVPAFSPEDGNAVVGYGHLVALVQGHRAARLRARTVQAMTTTTHAHYKLLGCSPSRHRTAQFSGMRSKTSTHAVRAPASVRRAFTILEMVVVLVLLGILIAFIYPRLSGNETLARDRRAQTSASAALDAVSTVFSSIGTSASVPTPPEAPQSASTCTLYVSPAVRSIMDRAPYPVQDLTRPASASATMCPVFANPAALASTTGDVQFAVPAAGDPAGHPAPSTGLNSASVAAVNTGLSWRVGVAVLSPQGGAGTTKATVSTCWMAWREYPLGGVASASARERYFYATNLSANATNCTGTDAVGRGTPPLWDGHIPPARTAAYTAMVALGAAALAQDGECELPTHAEPVRGLSWLSPCGDYN